MDDELKPLIARAKAGDRAAFDELVKATYQRVHALALRLTGNEHDADDVVQDTYVRAFRGLRKFRGEARFSTWLHRITANSASTMMGRSQRHRHDDIDSVIDLADHREDSDPEFQLQNGAVGARLRRALDNLPERLRNVVVLRDVHGMSHREIAEELDISEAAAKVRLHRARARLRDGLVAWRPGSTGETELVDSDGADDAEPAAEIADIIELDAHRSAS
ncbi:MAG: sigma-70 family RNA polymerase sigma factor [Actinomycetota bacterium]